ncbi:leucine-rich repeat protein [Butyrivibrio sp. INlla16]|uniref:leucine-rich repeat protein n=1 Tax=Butyrivibrio sp. INlla16 TaxID=1520807 RepID=UPI0008817320|nr:leucine-rich repeat protein [Butyrivibrio sp. INlla16]SDB67442.1 Leucine rich repeat-containing protein [Butyrivibrio sp. INlla16]
MKVLLTFKPITEEGMGAEMVEINGSVKIGGYNYPVTTIGKAAFKGYSNLKEIYIAADLKKVDKNAFTGLNKKNKVTIFIRTKNKKFYNRVRKVLKKAVPKNVIIKRYEK